MRFAWYGRKSVFKETSDSVDNQRRMCKEYVEATFPGDVEGWVEYSDEDFSGANTHRPDLQRLLSDIKLGLVDALVVYQLDRLSRSIRDFSNIYDILEQHGVKFISIKERIDTTTSIGRAMMYVTVIFAQMERETIASRIKDNLVGLARKGYWAGGTAPLGYTKERISINGRKHVILKPNPEEVEYIHWLIDEFMSVKSLISLQTKFKHQKIKAPRGGFFYAATAHVILKNPYGVEDTPEVYDYFAKQGCIMNNPREEWDGTHGIMIYSRHRKVNGKVVANPPDRWLVCIGYHEPIIKAETWLAVQAKFVNSKNFYETKYEPALLRGVLKCSCGCSMQVYRKDPKRLEYGLYFCSGRKRKGTDYCNMNSVRMSILDAQVVKVLKDIKADKSVIKKYIEADQPDPSKRDFETEIFKVKNKLRKLTESLVFAEDSAAKKYIIESINSTDEELQAIKRERDIQISEHYKTKIVNQSMEDKADEISNMMDSFDSLSMTQKNAIVMKLVKSCVWNGEKLTITF